MEPSQEAQPRSDTAENEKNDRYRGPDDYMTLTRHVLYKQKLHKEATGELTQLLTAIQTAVKTVSYAVRKSGITHLFGTAGSTNVQGEVVQKLDVLANTLFVNMIKSSYACCILVSEENETIIEVEPDKRGKYIICFDPLDGSSNINCLVSVGTIFAIFKKQDNLPSTDKHVLQQGNKLIAAGYALYGSATVMVLSTGDGVDTFMLDPSIGEFLLIEANVKIPDRGYIYSTNESYEPKWDDALREYIKNKKSPGEGQGKPYAARYVGSMVADIHRTIKYGGIFLYPPTAEHPEGKLRLMYECIPMAFLITQAGGLATNGEIPILDIVPEHIHQRSTIYLGSKEDVQELLDIMQKYKTKNE